MLHSHVPYHLAFHRLYFYFICMCVCSINHQLIANLPSFLPSFLVGWLVGCRCTLLPSLRVVTPRRPWRPWPSRRWGELVILPSSGRRGCALL